MPGTGLKKLLREFRARVHQVLAVVENEQQVAGRARA